MERSNIAPVRGHKNAPMQFSSRDLTEVGQASTALSTDHARATEAVALPQDSSADRVIAPEDESPTPIASPVCGGAVSDELLAEPGKHDGAKTKPSPIPRGGPIPVNTPTIKPIPGYPGYFAGRDGSIWSNKRGQLKRKSARPNQDGYFIVDLSNSGSSKTCRVNRLVAATFIGPIPEKYEANHKSGNKRDNAVDKLEICTHQQNIAHAISTGLSHPGQAQASKTHCKHGHEFTAANTYMHRNSRHCRACRRIDAANLRARHKK